LLENGADVNAQDKGGLIPLHNASSYGHLDIAALLIKHKTVVNATDKWGFTPLHEAAQKGRTQLCSLLLAHGADAYMKNQEGQTPIELATADDVKCLLQDAMATSLSQQALRASTQSLSDNSPAPDAGCSTANAAATCSSTAAAAASSAAMLSPTTETVLLPSGASMILSVPVPLPLNSCATRISPAQGAEANGAENTGSEEMLTDPESITNVSGFLSSQQLHHLIELFEREQITLDILAEMGHDDLKQVGVSAYGFRHKILKGIAQLRATTGKILNGTEYKNDLNYR